MVYKNMIIATKQRLTQAKQSIADALSAEARARQKKQFPLVYKYIESKKPEKQSETEEVIGSISDISFDKCGNIVGTVTINDCMKQAENFTGVIDNFSVKVIKNTLSKSKSNEFSPVFSHGIVYNKFVKQTIDAKRKNKGKQVHHEESSPDANYVTTITENNPLQDPSIVNELKKMMERELGKEFK